PARHPPPRVVPGGPVMSSLHLNRRHFLSGALGTATALALPLDLSAAVKKGTSLRLWILKTYGEPTNKAIEASAQRWADKHGASVTVEYFTFEDVQTKYVAAIENKNTPDVGQLGTGPPAHSDRLRREGGGRGRQAARQRGARHGHRRQDVRDPVVHHAGLLVR